VWQLGDLIDLWRTGNVEGMAFDKRMKLLEKSWEPILKRFERPGFPIRRLFGNHDEELARHGYSQYRFEPEDPGNTAGNDMLVIHGHQFDPIEDLPAWMKEHFMRAGTERITPYVRDFMSASNPHWAAQARADFSFTPPPPPRERKDYVCPDLTPLDLVPLTPESWNVQEIKQVTRTDNNPFNLATGPATLQDERNPSLWERGKVRARDAANAGYSVALVVVGHTHNPRIIRGVQPDGTPFVLMDAGGWIGPRFLSPGLNQMVHNCTIGVRVGSDIRIYQLTSDPYNWPKFK
jgi:UDP-2,3-diacylglucosamine pyrophosphatase LpxH